MKLKKFLLLAFFGILSLSQAQETQDNTSTENSTSEEVSIQDSTPDAYEIKRFSIGVKLGVPNIASLSVQYTLPLLNNHIAPYLDFSTYPYKDNDIDGDLIFYEFGVTYFFNQKGKGFYMGVGASSLKVKTTYNKVSLSEGRTGTGKANISLNTTNFKLGLKTGGRVYFRFELGYGMGDLPKIVTFTATDNSNPLFTESRTRDIPTIPGVFENGLLIGNIGFGLSF